MIVIQFQLVVVIRDEFSIFAFDAIDYYIYMNMYDVHESDWETMHVFIFKLDKITRLFWYIL